MKLREAASRVGVPTHEFDPGLTIPADPAHGDFASTIALSLAKQQGEQPRALASRLAAVLEPGGLLERVEVAGPGFINMYLTPAWLASVVDLILTRAGRYGSSRNGKGESINLEFVSANPTGPLGVVNARAAAVGDSLASVMEAAGYQVIREYYVNDAGGQVDRLGASILARCREIMGEPLNLPEDGYPGEYLAGIARDIMDEHGTGFLDKSPEQKTAFLGQEGARMIVEWHRRSLAAYGTSFDVWFSEKSLRDAGAVERALRALADRGHTYEEDGALWFGSTRFGDDKDRVLVKSDGQMTYLAGDLAYHLNKLERGFHQLIDIWGPDHHGAIVRLQAAVQAMGSGPGTPEVLICQLVNLVRGGERVRMSKRAGEIVDMDGFLEEVGRDAARFFFLMRSADSHLDFDLDLTAVQGQENPVYYVQYAHARMSSILRTAAEAGMKMPKSGEHDGMLLSTDRERALMRHLAGLPELVEEAARNREPHRLTGFARELATSFHSFYVECRVLGEEEDLSRARLALVRASAVCLARVLSLLGVSAPERM